MFRLALHWQILIAVILATLCGIALNYTISDREGEYDLGKGQYAAITDSTNRITISIYQKDPQADTKQLVKHLVVDPTGKTPDSVTTLEQLQQKDAKAFQIFNQHGRSQARVIGDIANYLGGLFLRLLKMVSIPLIISSLMSGVLGLADAGRLRKLFGYTILYYVSTSMLAIITGLFLVNLIQPGHRGTEAKAAQAKEVSADMGDVLTKQVEALIPTNPIESVAASQFLSIIAFTLIFGVAAIIVGGKTLQVFRDLFDAAFQVMMTITMAVIRLAPIGVFFLMLYATATQGIEVFQALGWYMLTVFSALAFHAVITLPLIVWIFARRSPWLFTQAMSPALLTAFSSASSNATLPLTLSCVETRAGISNRIGSFVLPLGATINMDGTALFEVIAVLFIAQMEPNIQLTLMEQVLVAFTALMASIGAAGIPHAGLVMMVIVLQAVGLPADRVGLILAVDRILDMCRTSVNVWSDSCGCAVIAWLDGGEAASGGDGTDVATGSDGTKISEQQAPAVEGS
jgi:proton glutamate symport protein